MSAVRRVRRAAVAWALVAPLVLLLAAAAGAQELARLFPEEADVFTDAAGLVRLPLPAPVVAACSPDLSDLRLFDASGREVPYVVDPGVPQGRERKARLVIEARVNDLEREEIPREGAKSATREVYRIALPERAPAGEAWTLVVDAAQDRFVRRIAVRGIAADGSEVPLVPRASLVRLGQPLVDRDRVALPPFAGGEIELVIEGEEGFFLEPVLRFASERKLGPAGESVVPLAILDRRAAGGRTVLDVARPPALVAARLRVATSTPVLDRRVRVEDVAADGTTRTIGEGRVRRAPLAGDLDGDALDVALERARGERLRVTIDDGDSPPLADLAFALAYDAPALLFVLPPGAGGAPAGVLRFGGDRAYAPRYDVAALLRDAVAANAGLLDARALPLARLGAVRANPSFDARPALAAVQRPGAALEVDAWQWRRPVTIPASPEGLVELRLAPEDLARARADRADLRIVGADQRQWPYLVAPAVDATRVALALAGPRTKEGRSTWRIALPVAALVLDRIVVETARPVLGRRFRLLGEELDGTRRELAAGTLAQDLRRPAPLTIAFPETRLARLELEVEDGDDAPIEIASVVAPLALPRLLIAAPAGAYALLAGNPDADPARYEIERARDVVRDLRTVPATAGPGSDNAAWTGTPGGSARRRALLQQVAIWSAIVLAVAVLGVVTLRLVRRSD